MSRDFQNLISIDLGVMAEARPKLALVDFFLFTVEVNTAGEVSILELQPFEATGHKFSFRLTCGSFVAEMLVPGTGSQIHNIPDWNCWLCVSCRDLPELELAQGKERNLTINFKGPPLVADRSINIAMDDVATVRDECKVVDLLPRELHWLLRRRIEILKDLPLLAVRFLITANGSCRRTKGNEELISKFEGPPPLADLHSLLMADMSQE
ncbi:hypothetical protein B0H17DRAFT_1148152 [Mycena rosella]|uniref:Uncharacterized protein n=1 Tax=Mycena rosella TaxID=1033263 RepID=A0AAD7FZK9_MYCRO|nr:hypothetical protein B0H17DRAFT_1148152 [Mycena rosella]